jgi:hypothetical protein
MKNDSGCKSWKRDRETDDPRHDSRKAFKEGIGLEKQR